MLLRNSAFIALSFGCLAVVIGCADSDSPTADESSPPTAAVTLANAVCPIMGGAAKNDVTVRWNAKTVGFCCPECIPEWNSLSEDDKTAKLAAAVEQIKEDQHDDGEQVHAEHDHSEP